MAPAILSRYPLQIPLDVCWLRSADVNMLLIEISQKMVGYSHTLTHSGRSVLFPFQVISKFGKPRFVAEI
jgi:hypothetical protein